MRMDGPGRIGRRRLRVLHVIGTLDAGGAERVLVALLRRLGASRISQAVHLLTARGPLSALVPAGCAILGAAPAAPTASLLRSVTRFRPDVVHTWADDAAVTVAPIAAALDLPWVHRIANIPSAQYRLHPREPAFLRGFGHALRVADRVCALSDAAAEDATDYFGIERPAVIYNGFPLAARHDCRPLGRPAGRFLLLAVGRLDVEKGHAILLDALPAIDRAIPNVACWIAGTGPLAGVLGARASALGLDRVVTWLGYRKDVRRLLAATDVFVMPSLYEGFGNAVLEAMRASVPVVASDLPVLRNDVLRGAPAAVLVAPGDSAALAEAVISLARSPDRRDRMAAQARDATTRYAAGTMVREWGALYRAVANDRRPRPAAGRRRASR